MRSISLFEKIELDYKGTVFQSAICLLDIDNDKHNELCICNTNGDLQVFKGIKSPKPWTINKNVGPVVVLCGGNIHDRDENILCALDTEGTCTLYDVYKDKDEETLDDITGVPPTDMPISPTSFGTSKPGELRIFHQEMLAPNARCAILEDIDNDGIDELIVGFITDRFVRIYKWKIEDSSLGSLPSSSSSPSKTMSIKSTTRKTSKDQKNDSLKKEATSHVSQDSERRKSGLSHSLSTRARDPSCSMNLSKTHDAIGMEMHSQKLSRASFVQVRQYSLFSQVGSIAVCNIEDGMKQLIVSQPNGTYCNVETFARNCDFSDLLDSAVQPGQPIIVTPDALNPFEIKLSGKNSYTSTKVIGGIKRGHEQSCVIGLSTLDGNFMILEDPSVNTLHPKKNWFQSEHRWFSMSKFDVTNDGDDEIILASMNGMTYMIDKDRNIVSYNFNENIAAFCAGGYGPIEPNNTSNNCLCYVTLNGKIHVYYNVWISAMKVKCVHGAIIEKLKHSEDLKYILDGLKLPSGDIDHKKIQMLVKNTWSEKYN